jgi:hypothetical protein
MEPSIARARERKREAERATTQADTFSSRSYSETGKTSKMAQGRRMGINMKKEFLGNLATVSAPQPSRKRESQNEERRKKHVTPEFN